MKQIKSGERIAFLALLLVLFAHITATAGEEKRALPEWSEPGKLLEMAIKFNKEVQEPELDTEKMKKEFEALVEKAGKELRSHATEKEKAAALARVLFADRGVMYLSNMYWRDSTLAAALLRKRGNCLATTTLYVLVARHLGLPV
ncbi:MAG: transglutaminase family protein, partial [Planctomycetota bacterium]